MPATAADLELAERIAPVLADEDYAAASPTLRPAAGSQEKTSSGRGSSATKWLIWVVVVVLVGMISRRMLRANSAAH